MIFDDSSILSKSSAWNSIAVEKKGRLDYVVDALTAAEFDDSMPSVGSGPNIDERGEITLDAMIMDG